MTRIVVVGLGPIGLSVARAVRDAPDLTLAGLVDTDPAKLGRTLDALDAANASLDDDGPRVVDAVERSGPADVAIVCTSSHFDRVAPLLRACVTRRLHVTSSCEEMAWPKYRHADLADEINGEAHAAGVALVGTGVNPGYVMDLLAVQLSSMLTRVTRVTCTRRVDALARRLPLQRKVGSTLSVAEFDALKAQEAIGHKGLAESVALIAAGVGRTAAPGSVVETLDALVADRPIASGLGTIEPGRVRGIRNAATWSGEGLAIELDLTMACAEPDPRDEIRLEGDATALTLNIPGSTPGDSATVAALVNTARLLPRLPTPGLKTMLDLPAAGAR